MKNFIFIILSVVLLASCAARTPAVAPQAASTYDQSWSAAVDALRVQGVRITSQDREAGIVEGVSKGITISANIKTQADGSVRAQFNTIGTTNSDPGLIRRITKSYNSRVGQ
ncbi:MAG: hypothetical protein methR_P1356 [Methyloprofundus sp.]|nr:MAG: hypothetical protein methR_P1356 [Methyloprofundus sp.]